MSSSRPDSANEPSLIGGELNIGQYKMSMKTKNKKKQQGPRPKRRRRRRRRRIETSGFDDEINTLIDTRLETGLDD